MKQNENDGGMAIPPDLVFSSARKMVRGKKTAPVAIPLTLFSSVRKLLLTLKTDLSLKGRGEVVYCVVL